MENISADYKDPHRLRASEMFGIPYEKVTLEQRREGKIANFKDKYEVIPLEGKYVNHFYSERGIPLVYWFWDNNRQDESVVTCENYLKWYSLYVVTPEDKVLKLYPHEFTDWLNDVKGFNETIEGDHCYNPKAVELICEKMGWYLDDSSKDMIVRRWQTDYLNLS